MKSFENQSCLVADGIGPRWAKVAKKLDGRVLPSTDAPVQPFFKLVQILCPGVWASPLVNKSCTHICNNSVPNSFYMSRNKIDIHDFLGVVCVCVLGGGGGADLLSIL
jgi:hypothetical protein